MSAGPGAAQWQQGCQAVVKGTGKSARLHGRGPGGCGPGPWSAQATGGRVNGLTTADQQDTMFTRAGGSCRMGSSLGNCIPGLPCLRAGPSLGLPTEQQA